MRGRGIKADCDVGSGDVAEIANISGLPSAHLDDTKLMSGGECGERHRYTQFIVLIARRGVYRPHSRQGRSHQIFARSFARAPCHRNDRTSEQLSLQITKASRRGRDVGHHQLGRQTVEPSLGQ